MQLRALFVAFVVATSAVPFLIAAQTFTPEALRPPTPAGTTSCFDYYSFGSVQAKLTIGVPSTVSGAIATFSGTLENANPYPIVDGALYVKVFKSRGGINDGNGPDVVDQFFVRDNITIPANGSVPISFFWKVPGYAASGEYSMATFFTTSHKFNLLGLSFTDDIVGNTVPFTIEGEQEGSVGFDKASVTVNGDPYYFAAYPPHAGNTPTVVQALARNTSGMDATVDVIWKIYQWDAQQEANIVQQEQTSVRVPANGSAPVSITVSDAQYPVYLATAELSWNDTKSIIAPRFVREDNNRTRLNFPGIMSFPLKAQEPNTLFSCLHNAGQNSVPNGRLELLLQDRSGRTISEHTYTGDVTSAMMGVASPFIPTRDYDFVTLVTRLYQGDTLVDEATVTYDCSAIDPSQCAPAFNFSLISGIIGFIILFAVAIGLLALYRRMHPADIASSTITPTT